MRGTLLGLANSLYLAPRANQAILDMEQALETSQASYEIQPRVFYEDFKNFVLYVQDVRSGTGAANWRQVFMADVTDPCQPANHHRRLRHRGQRHQPGTADAAAQRSAARDGGRPAAAVQHLHLCHHRSARWPLSQQSDVHLGRLDTAIYALPMSALLERIHGPDGKRFLIELHNRFAYPAACLVLMLVGVPLGVASRRGGKSSGFVFTILLVFLYYFLSYTGIALGRQNKTPGILRGVVWPTCSLPRAASSCCGRWPAAAAF